MSLDIRAKNLQECRLAQLLTNVKSDQGKQYQCIRALEWTMSPADFNGTEPYFCASVFHDQSHSNL